MRYLKLLLSLTLFFSFYYQSNAQNPNQGVNGNIDNAAINSQYLNGSKIQLSSAATTSVKYNIDMSRSSNGANWHPVNMKVGLGYLDGNSYKFFSGGHTFVGADFSPGQATLSKELTSVIDHTKLPNGSMIYVLYENHRPNVPQSGWFVEALAFSNNQVRYGFILGTTGGPNPENPGSPGSPVGGVPPAFTAPEVGSVPLYEYVSGNKRRLTTTYYSSYPGFTYNGILGYVFTSAITGTVPLYRFIHPSNGNYYYSINQAGPTAYMPDGIACYVYVNQTTNAFPVYVNYSASLGGYHRYSNYPYIFPNYSFDGVKFYILQNLPPVNSELVPIYSYVKSNGGGQHLLSTSTQEGSYWRNEGVNFSVYKTQVNNSVAFRNLRPKNQSDNLYTSGFADSYWTLDFGIKFYAYLTQVSGTIPIYDYTNSSGKDHYFSPYIEGDPYWVRHGIAFYAFPKP